MKGIFSLKPKRGVVLAAQVCFFRLSQAATCPRSLCEGTGVKKMVITLKVKYVFDNAGNRFSSKNVADYFKSQQRKIDLNTVYNYLSALQSAKFVLTMDPLWKDNIEGIKHMHVADWLLMKEWD